MSYDYSELYNFLSTSLQEQTETFAKQLILNPVENIPDPKYLSCCTSFLQGIYNSDKLRSETSYEKSSIN